jgi:hypothetical protein
MQQRRAGPWQTSDEEGASDRLSGNLRVALAIFLETESIAQQPQDVVNHADPPNEIKMRIHPKGMEQDSKPLPKRIIAKIVEAGFFAGLVKQIALIQVQKGKTVLREPPAQAVDGPQQLGMFAAMRCGPPRAGARFP